MALLLARLGRFSARHRVLVFLTWGLVGLMLAVFAVVGFVKPPAGASSGFDVPGTESSRALAIVDEEFPQADAPDNSGSLQLVVQSPEDGGLLDDVGKATVEQARAKIASLAHVDTVTDPYDPASPYVSADGTTAVVTVNFVDLDAAAEERAGEEMAAVADNVRDQGMTAEVGGSLSAELPEILGPSELVGAALAFLVLFVTFGSLIAAGANMLGALVGVAVGVVGIFAVGAFSPVGTVTPILAVMLGLAVGIDYCLFVLARYRAELMEGRDVMTAIGRAVGTAGSSVTFAGATVIIALVGLSVVGIPFITEMGIAAAFSVAVAVAMALTFLPALLRGMGVRALSKKQRDVLSGTTDDSTKTREAIPFVDRWADLVTRRRVLSIVVGVVALGVVAIPATQMRTTLSVPGGENPASSQRAAYALVEDEFGGVQSPLVVLVEGDAVSTRLDAVVSTLQGLDDVQLVVPAATSSDNQAALVQVIPESGPIDDSTRQLVTDIRAGADGISGVTLSVTGETAIGIDSDAALSKALVIYVALIVGLSFVLLVLLFRSLLVPLVATVGYLLSLAAGLGATVAVFQFGWLESLFPSPQGDPLLSFLPIIVAGILFGLAMDYQVFLVSRMHEAHERGYSPREAILDGFGRSAPVVIAAAAIMTAVFGGFALAGSSLVASIALGLAVGVVADAFVVRMVLVPATLALLGRAAWWMPQWLQRVLPRIDTEGHALDAAAGEAVYRVPARTA